MEQDAQEKAKWVETAIRHAFAGVSLGDGISLHEANVIDNYGTHEQRKQARKLDAESHWWDVPAEKIERFSGALFFMDAAGFRYYIPAYMTQALKTCEKGSLALDAALNSLFALSEETEELFSLLDDPQKKAIAQFLWFIATETNGRWSNKLETHNATRALEDFWYPYLS